MSDDVIETVLGQSRALFKGLLDNELGGLYVIQDNKFVYVNQRFCDLFGYRPDEVCGVLGPMALTAHEDRAIAQKAIDRRVSGESKTGHYTFRALRQDQSSFFAEVFGVGTEYEGRPAIIGILIDVTERMESDIRAKEHSSFIARLMDIIPNPVYYKARNGRYLGCNLAFEALVGQKRGAIVGKTVFDLFPAHIATTYNAADQWLFEHPGTQQYEAQVTDAAGVDRDMLFYKATFNATGGRVNGLVGVMLDITDRKRVEEELCLGEEAFVNSQQAIVVTDEYGRILKVNPAFCAISGLTPGEALGQVSPFFSRDGDPGHDSAVMRHVLDAVGNWEGDYTSHHREGAVYVEHAKISAIRDSDGQIYRYVIISSDITAFRDYQRRIEHMAHYDSLTNLANRALLYDRLAHAIAVAQRQSKWLAVCFLDLDEFKPINDVHGHEQGDLFLVEISRRLKGQMRASDLVARLGGDEFVLLLEDIEDLKQIEHAVNRVMAVVALPHRVEDLEMVATTSIGVAIYPKDGQDPDTLIRHADQAMYAAKRAGKNQCQFFDAETDRKIQVGRQFLARVEQGLAAGEFHLHYQPKVELATGRVVGVEALIRWQHPERGMLSPADFTPALEDRAFAPTLGRWVMTEALRQIALWADEGVLLGVSVNIAGVHLQQPGFIHDLRDCLDRFPAVSPSLLQIEILETGAIEDIDHVGQVIEDCQRLGVGCALDDFGTGYSSLTYLRRMPVRILKIDRSFVLQMLDNRDDRAIVDGVIGLGKAFGRQVIAEGVESVEHGLELRRLGCDMAQGFGIARPMPADRVRDWIAQWSMPPEWGVV